ncbi:3-hydroxyacyl-ACP dehydratase [Chitinophagaceae bacterium LB-8]|uniref:3-hydroxyacyl-ACP dehydratase n=1 Tax=Paraflavisolibacter caeni TaxID=2982496 RepID=A0A9X2XYK9_9BACT|nr:3-hydroxyacyl-ACP dehydratase [Paraflavisolibacter caeni]MCU7551595.1 3-hydroxyacyl-ACP dehydratase [Paraflavisolibacter caeni]
MTLINDLFEIMENSGNESSLTATIKLHPGHIIYKGHFPGHPVTPGVIQVQIVQELLENQLKRKLNLIEMPDCKFLKVLNPAEVKQLTVSIEYAGKDDLLNVKAIGKNDSGIFFKLSAVYHK